MTESFSSTTQRCEHVWTAWTTEERSLGHAADVTYIMVRRCVRCTLADEGRDEVPSGWNIE